MTATAKKRLCWNCEGNVARGEEHCSFCGVYLDGTLDAHTHDDEDDYSPPYQMAPTPKPAAIIPQPIPVVREEIKALDTTLSMPEQKSEIGSFVFLLTGSIFFLFGMMLFLFSQNGVITLQWNSNYWFVYLVASAPLLFLGWRSLRELKA